MGLQPGVDVEGRRGEGPQGGRDRRAERYIQVAEAKHLHLDGVTGDFRRVQAAGSGDALAVLVHEDRVEQRIQIRVAVAVLVVEAAQVDLDALAGHAGRHVADHAAFALHLGEADPAVAVGVGEREGLQPHLQPDHLEQAAAVDVRGVAARAAVLGHGDAGAGVAIRIVVAGGAGVGVAAVHHLGGRVGEQHALDLAGVAVDAIAVAEVALRQAFAPHVAQPGIDLLQIHRAAFQGRVGGVDDADARVLDGAAREVARRIDGVVGGAAGPLRELGAGAEGVAQVQGAAQTGDEAADPQRGAVDAPEGPQAPEGGQGLFTHGSLHTMGTMVEPARWRQVSGPWMLHN